LAGTAQERFAFPLFATGLVIVGLSISAMISMAQVLAVQEFNASYTEQGVIGALRSIPYVISAVVVGYFLSYVNKRTALSLSSILVAASSIYIAASSSMLDIYISQLIFSLGLAFYWPVAESILADVFKDSDKLKAYGKYSASWNGGFLLGAIFSGVVGEVTGLRTMFTLAALISLLAVFPILKINMNKSTLAASSVKMSYFKALTPAYVITLPVIAVFGAILTLIPGYAWRIGFVILEIGIIMVPMWVLRIIASLYLALRPPKRVNIVLALIGLSMASALLTNTLVQNYISVVLLLSVVGIAISYFYAVMFYIISSKAKVRTELAIGGYESVIGMGFFLGPPAAGLVADYLGVTALFIFLALVSLVAAATGALIYRASSNRFHRYQP